MASVTFCAFRGEIRRNSAGYCIAQLLQVERTFWCLIFAKRRHSCFTQLLVLDLRVKSMNHGLNMRRTEVKLLLGHAQIAGNHLILHRFTKSYSWSLHMFKGTGRWAWAYMHMQSVCTSDTLEVEQIPICVSKPAASMQLLLQVLNDCPMDRTFTLPSPWQFRDAAASTN